MPLVSSYRSAISPPLTAFGPADSGSPQICTLIANPKLALPTHGTAYYLTDFSDSFSSGPSYRPVSSSASASTSDSVSTVASAHSSFSSTAAMSPMATQDPDAVKHDVSHYDGASSTSGSDSKHDSGDAAVGSGRAFAPGYTQPRKRASRAGTRSVTTLSAAQLERKRANDREAQRAIRARTKEHIEKLEHRLLELTSNGSQSEQMLIKRNRELEAENAMLRAKLQQTHYSFGAPDAQDAGWNGHSQMMRTPITNGGLTVMSQPQPQLQTALPSSARHEPAAAPQFGTWQDPSNTFGSPIRRNGPASSSFPSDMSSRRENVSPGGVTPISATSAPASQGVEYTYRPGLAPQYNPISESGAHQLNRDSGMAGMHMGQPGMASYGAPAQQNHGPPSLQQQPRFMPYHPTTAAGPQGHQPQQQQSGANGTSTFTAQNQSHQTQLPQPQSQSQQGMYYTHAAYGH